MNILLINLILHTAENGVIPKRESNSDAMIYNMARGFVANGHKVTLLVAEEFRPLKEENNPFEVIYFASRLPKILKPDLLPWPKGMLSWLSKNRAEFDAVITSETFSIGSLYAAMVFPAKTLIWQEMSLLQHAFRKLPARVWHHVVVPLFMKKVAVAARSEAAKRFISKYMHNVRDEVVDHGINGETFHPDGLPKERRVVVISQLVPRKRIDTIILRFEELIKMPGYEDFILDVVGDGPSETELKDLVERLRIGDNIVFHGRLTHSEFGPISRRAMAMLVNTEKDLNMVSIQESIVSGTPVMMNTVPTTAAFVNREELGIAKEDWTAEDLRTILDHNEHFVANCLRVRESLLNTGCAARLLDLLN